MPGSTKLSIPGPAGQLQALWRSGGNETHFTKAAVICHPHPQYGGTMENKVVARCARYISEAGIEAIRFNFRGVGQSEGAFDNGRGEREDLVAVIDHVSRASPPARIAVVGFSFGAWIGLDVGDRDGRVQALVGLAPPVRMFDIEHVAGSSKPRLIVYAENDQYTPASATRAWIESSHQPIESVCIPAVDHFFGHQVDAVGQKVAEFLKKVL